jgi:hypothetical protein
MRAKLSRMAEAADDLNNDWHENRNNLAQQKPARSFKQAAKHRRK